MLLGPGKFVAFAFLFLTASLPLRATVAVFRVSDPILPQHLQTYGPSSRSHLLESLRRDVAAHPADFITFETEASARRFLVDHAVEAYRETDPRIISRGIVGYDGSKTLVVLPTLAAASLR
ncbi:MAG: hypothetical protein M3Y50_13430 [Acidobacteriota bacterium]|nr:hypothetical protein [Acidobacteriota bacterium]